MSLEGEFGSYEPLRRILDSPRIQELQDRMLIRLHDGDDAKETILVQKANLPESNYQPDLVLAIDGDSRAYKPANGFPGAEIGYVTIASVLIDMQQINELAKEEFISPKKFREMEKASTFESVFPGNNMIVTGESSPKSSLRRYLFDEMQRQSIFSEGETLLDTYEYLLKIKRSRFPDSEKSMPDSPIEGIDEKMTYGYGEFPCKHTGKPLFSTDALRLHELMTPSGSNGELFGQIKSTLEKLWLIHILRAFERKGWLATLRRVAFIMDGPLAVFSTSSWLAKTIAIELRRLNDLQKTMNGNDLLLIGIEKSGSFYKHFTDIDTSIDGLTDKFPRQSALLLTDSYIKENIIYSESIKPYGQDTYFGRKLFYKTNNGQKLVAVLATYTDAQKDLETATPDQFPRLNDVMNLLDHLGSNQYPNSVSALISAHSEAVTPLYIGKRIFEDIAREIRERSLR
ncbi:DNA double-strand break repair nuclease NurA [Sediminibacterium roseum]|uniref:DNA double-strand break repair nuclease NurA n=1 Tax=Sediminibacterium roseum TaxID=1978412 RepID=A0ABW9ZUS6_9BACT|nr:DNA double-strand break repair nuclease NurA [Sediminibacterium roseum]NCI50912.1 DNA double-strand break repair nuclease NurA [Sediminibacterium roseum]